MRVKSNLTGRRHAAPPAVMKSHTLQVRSSPLAISISLPLKLPKLVINMFIFYCRPGHSLLDQLLHETDTDAVRREEKERTGSVYFIIIYSRYSFVLKLNK